MAPRKIGISGDGNVGSALERALNVLEREIGFRLMRR
jgi:predicted dinucleotide-binding enzyme